MKGEEIHKIEGLWDSSKTMFLKKNECSFEFVINDNKRGVSVKIEVGRSKILEFLTKC